MIENEVVEELERQLEIWSMAFRNVNDMNTELLALDTERANLSERIDAEQDTVDTAAATVNEIVADIEDEADKDRVKAILGRFVSAAVVDGFVQ